MEDLIAQLFPIYPPKRAFKTQTAYLTVQDPRNRSRLYQPPEELLGEVCGRTSRQTTAPPEENDDKTKHNSSSACLKLTFSNGPKAAPGFLFGTDANVCDIVVPSIRGSSGISRQHFYLTFDAHRRLVVRDCSTYGSTITYDGRAGSKRRNFTWIVSGHQEITRETQIVLTLPSAASFLIVVPAQTSPELYAKRVDQFQQDLIASSQLPLNTLGLFSTDSTADASTADTPGQSPILLPCEELGRGAFSVVYRAWDVSTGLIYALKEFNNIKVSDWKAEASMMKHVSHEHVVKLAFALRDPRPGLALEYLSLGSLYDQHKVARISDYETVVILQQCLQALVYLHDQHKPAIVHRDIKPANILVQSRTPLRVKLADFGLSKAGSSLHTFCGSPLYVAPEIMAQRYTPAAERKYTKAVDIWSLGIVAFEFGYGLPSSQSRREHDSPWTTRVIAKLEDEDTDDLIELLTSMLVARASERASAADCLAKSLLLTVPEPGQHQIAGSQDCGQSETTNVYDYSAERTIPQKRSPSSSVSRVTAKRAPRAGAASDAAHDQRATKDKDETERAASASRRTTRSVPKPLESKAQQSSKGKPSSTKVLTSEHRAP